MVFIVANKIKSSGRQFLPRDAMMLARQMLSPCVRPSAYACLSVTRQTRITQTISHDSPGTL